MEKRAALAIFLSFLVLVIYQSLVPPPTGPGSQPATNPATTGPPDQSGPSGQRSEGQKPAPETTPRDQPGPLALPVVSADERDVVVENDAVRATFTNRGGVLKSWRLKRYLDADGQPLELVPADVPGARLPFSLRLDDPLTTLPLPLMLFRPSADALKVDAPKALRFEFTDTEGLRVWKEFAFDPARPYVIAFSAGGEVRGKPLNPIVELGAALGSGRNISGSSYYTAPRAILNIEGDVERIGADKLGDPARASFDGNFPFAGVDDHYFLSAVVRPDTAVHVEYKPVSVAGATENDTRNFILYSTRFASPPSKESFFLGPKDFDVLAGVDRDLVRAIDFGIFAWLVVPLLRALKWINASVGNYGWSIIILTILINAAMFPLRHKSVVSMRKMQAVQPEVKAIQDRYAKLKLNDPARQKMNVELMNLYRERGVNPASGCVPMLLTMPVLFAFYALLSVAIELRGAPFVGWIKDLSLHDPLYITPVLMGASMLWQQKLTPVTSADPIQQKMMLFMPIMFTFFFLWAPSGLVLYWFVSNLWAIGQQILTNRIIGPPRLHAARPAAERRVKRVGGGRTDPAQTTKPTT
jgi:YidC/Oxa1 family membrane protein insertase